MLPRSELSKAWMSLMCHVFGHDLKSLALRPGEVHVWCVDCKYEECNMCDVGKKPVPRLQLLQFQYGRLGGMSLPKALREGCRNSGFNHGDGSWDRVATWTEVLFVCLWWRVP